ncbi:G-protein-signaling modulator 1-like [Syngnathus acus]|uniref:G-protein-signaling modulator 1-like n=1 Tax=Syngnathus acus TaxID=161584 RepID=UPI001885DDF7|nr:G-protein-signaling modulator 1-like [Syngnathus acus]
MEDHLGIPVANQQEVRPNHSAAVKKRTRRFQHDWRSFGSPEAQRLHDLTETHQPRCRLKTDPNVHMAEGAAWMEVADKATNKDDKTLKDEEEESQDVDCHELEMYVEDSQQAVLLPTDFPESLYELLCTLQEGRRLNDQRCSFLLDGGMRRRCHSEPNAAKPSHRVIFSSMTSLQREEFFELVTRVQARRLDEQRAQLRRSPRGKQKGQSFPGSLKQLSLARRAPKMGAKEELYDMILTTQAQGRLEEQRSRAPGPMDDDDFFSLLLRVQGGRMDEQRTEPLRMPQT